MNTDDFLYLGFIIEKEIHLRNNVNANSFV